MQKSIKVILGILAIVLVSLVVFYGYNTLTGKVISGADSQTNQLAKHLTSIGAKMYGTEWCSFCSEQKKLFGDSFEYIDYIDCGQDKDICVSAGVLGYPTWIINGQNYPGLQSLDRLENLSNFKN